MISSAKSARKRPRGWRSVFGGAPDREVEVLRRHWFDAVVVLLFFAVCVAAITKFPAYTKQDIGYDIDKQPVALEEVRAAVSFKAEDLQATKYRRDEAAMGVPDTYRVDGERVRKQRAQLEKRIAVLADKRDAVANAVREALAASNSTQGAFEVVSGAVTALAAELREEDAFKDFPSPAVLALWLMPAPGSIPKRRFLEAAEPASAEAPATDTASPAAAAPAPLAVAGLDDAETSPFEFAYAGELSRVAYESLEYVLTYGVIDPETAQGNQTKTIVIMREDPLGDQKVSDELPIGQVPTPETAEERLSARIAEAVRGSAIEEGQSKEGERPTAWTDMQRAALAMAKPFMSDTVFFDRVYTAGTRERVRMAVEPAMKEIQTGEVIQRSGDKWTAQSRSDVKTYWRVLHNEQPPFGRFLVTLIAQTVFVGLVFVCLIRFILLFSRKDGEKLRNLNLALVLLTAMLVLGRVVSYFEPSGYVIPVAAVAVLLAILVNARVAIIVGFLISALVSAQFGYDWRLLMVQCAMSVAGVFSIRVVRRRSDMTSAAVKATVVGLLTLAALTLAGDPSLGGPALQRFALVLLNGLLCLFVVPGVLAPIERLFGITTDIQLLEYSDLNNPVLSRLAIEVPATYAHSLMLGQLAEAAADAIGANGLLARVCAYYHDVGKLRRPEYFTENQAGVNIHDELPPRASARAIGAHVMQGVELAREYHLPKPIIDGILEHHGTGLIGFFYQQAVEQDKHDAVREQDFRYPGPKPQSQETAILMICDAVESGVRSIKHPNEERVREFVDKIVRSRFADRQFDECNLTLKELDTIKAVVTRRLVTSLHTRIAYPEKEPEKGVDNVISIPGVSR